MRSLNVFGIFSMQILRFLVEIYDFEQFSWAPVQDFSKNTLLLYRYLCIFSIISCFSCFNQVLEHCLWCFGISLLFFVWFFNFWTNFADFGWIWCPHRWFSTILSDFASMARAKQHRERQKWMRFYTFSQVSRRRVFLTNATPGLVFFVVILWWIFDDFEQFLHPWREQSNTGNDKNERNLMHFCRSSDGVRFWPLQQRRACFFVLILRWF